MKKGKSPGGNDGRRQTLWVGGGAGAAGGLLVWGTVALLSYLTQDPKKPPSTLERFQKLERGEKEVRGTLDDFSKKITILRKQLAEVQRTAPPTGAAVLYPKNGAVPAGWEYSRETTNVDAALGKLVPIRLKNGK